MSKGDGRPRGSDFFAKTGIALPDTLPSAAEMLGRGSVDVRRSLVLRDTLLSAAVILIGAVMHRAWPCYVVIVRPER